MAPAPDSGSGSVYRCIAVSLFSSGPSWAGCSKEDLKKSLKCASVADLKNTLQKRLIPCKWHDIVAQLAATVIVINLLRLQMISELLEQLVTNLYNVDVSDLSTLNKQSEHMSVTSCTFFTRIFCGAKTQIWAGASKVSHSCSF